MEQDIDSMVDLDQVYQEATNRLGMRLPGPSEVYYISYEPVSYTTKYKQIEKKIRKCDDGTSARAYFQSW